MRTRNPLSLLVFGSLALGVLIWACQVQDGSFPTEADRSIQQAATCDPALAAEIRGLINTVITDPIVGKSVTSQFNAIVKACPKNLNDAISKTKSTTDFIIKHFAAGKWTDEDGTGVLVAKMYEFVGLLPEAENATACIPNVDCDLTATEDNEFAGAQIPGSSITQPFVIFVTPLPDFDVDPPLFGLVYEIGTIPAGITFPPAPSGSLTLASEDDQPVVGVCTLDSSDPEGVPAGVPQDSLYVVHLVNGEWVRLPQVQITFLDCSTAESDLASAGFFSSPVDFALAPLIDLLTPKSLTAVGTRTGGAITSFSPHATEVAGTLPTTTTVSIVEGTTSFTVGQTITLRAVVNPRPANDENPEVVFRVLPLSGGGAPVESLVDGEAEHTFVCGSAQVPVGDHTAGAAFLGTSGFLDSSSGQVLSFQCLAN